MKILSLDISTSTGWALYENGRVEYGLIKIDIAKEGYPFNYIDAAQEMAHLVSNRVIVSDPHHIVIEETNMGKSLFDQKKLEFIHCAVLCQLKFSWKSRLTYVSSRVWRSALGLKLSKEDRANNKYYKDQREAEKERLTEDVKVLGIKKAADRKKLVGDGMRGFKVILDGQRVTKIHEKDLVLAYVNRKYGLELKKKDDDLADAIGMAEAFEVIKNG